MGMDLISQFDFILFLTRILFKGEVHPDIKLVLIEAEKWEKQASEIIITC